MGDSWKQALGVATVPFVASLCALLCLRALTSRPLPRGRCFNEAACALIPPVDGSVMVLQPEEPKISLSGVHHFARAASEFESSEGVFLFPELRIISTITREVEPNGEGDEDPTGNGPSARDGSLPCLQTEWRPSPGTLVLGGLGDLNVLPILESDPKAELIVIFGNPLGRSFDFSSLTSAGGSPPEDRVPPSDLPSGQSS